MLLVSCIHVHFMHTIYPKGLQENTQRGNPTQNGLSQRKWNVFFSVYSHINTDYKISGKLRHGPQFALICSLQKWGGGLYLRALDEET